MTDPVVHLTNGVPDGGTGNITTLGQLLAVMALEGGNLAAILSKLSADPATQTTLASVLSALATNHTDLTALHADIATTLLAKDEAIRALLAGTLSMAQIAGENHIGEVGGNTAVAGGSFTRPADTTAYAIGDLVSNNTTGSSVVAIPCAVARKNAGTGVITGARLSKSNASLTNASFRVHLFKTAPTTTPGDNAAFVSAVSGVAAVALGYIDIGMDQAYTDGAKGFTSINAKAFDAAAGSQNIYALIEARGVYTPASAEVFTLALEVLRD